ncbi:MAG: lysophospholipid acyltransferase family protein [bacterium]
MIIFRGLHSIFLYSLTIISFFVGSTLTLTCSLFVKDKIKLYQTAASLWARFLLLFSGSKIILVGQDNLPAGTPCIVVANHQGAADIPILLAYLPVRFRFAIKKELFGIPVFGWYLRQAGYFSVDRESFRSAYKTIEVIIGILKTGKSVLVFPEGTRSKDGTLGKFKRGSLMAALKSGAPIIPVAISGSYNVLPRGTYLINPTKIKLSIGKPIYIKNEAEYDAKVEETRSAIERMM